MIQDQLYTTEEERKKYAKHMEVFRLGAKQNNRIIATDYRVGATVGIGWFEVACHLTGNYPDWWEGKRFKDPVHFVVATTTNRVVRDVMQKGLSDIIPIKHVRYRPGIGGLIDVATVEHVSGNVSRLQFKSYEGRGTLRGIRPDGFWFDEQAPAEWLEEVDRALMLDPDRLFLYTKKPDFHLFVSWDDAAHLTADMKAQMRITLPPFMLRAA